MKPWRICRPVVADLHHFDVEQDLDLDPDQHQSEKSDPEPHQSEKRIRVRIKVMRIRNPAHNPPCYTCIPTLVLLFIVFLI